jgi:hypothetical protein
MIRWLKNLLSTPSPRLRLRRTLSDTLQYSIELAYQIEILQIEAKELQDYIARLQEAIAVADTAVVEENTHG